MPDNLTCSPPIDFQIGRWSPSTRQVYEGCWRNFTAYCEPLGLMAMPAKPQTIAEFLMLRAQTHSTSWLSGCLAAIVAVHKIKKKPIRVNETVIRDAWAEIRRAKGTAKKPKQALDDKAIKRIISKMPPEAVRDRAIILFAYASLMRRSEIAALNREDIDVTDTAMIITIRRSKADKAGKGQDVAVRRSGTEYCPVAALEAWLTAASIEDGPVFRNRDGTRIIGRTVADVAKKWAGAVGFKALDIGAHSFRRGGITSMFRNGGRMEDIMKISRHATMSIALGYVESQQAASNPALDKLGI
jgi:integrase